MSKVNVVRALTVLTLLLAACQPAAAPPAQPTAKPAAAQPTAKPAAAQPTAKPAAAQPTAKLAAAQPTAKPAVAQPTAKPAAKQPAQHSAEVQRLLDAARQNNETELHLSWSGNTLGGADGAKAYEALMTRMYGIDVKLNFTPGPSMTDMSGKITQEVAAGVPASTDVLLAAESHYSALTSRDVMERYDFGQLTPRVQQEMVAPNNIGVQFSSRIPGITYNSTLIPPSQAPKTLRDVLKPEWKGQFASTVNAASFDRVSFRPEWSEEEMRQYVKELSGHVGGLIRCGESSRLISGEFTMLVMDCGSYEARKRRLEGAPLEHVIPEDAAHVVFWYMGVPRNSAKPNLAKLFINAVLSEEGQKALWELEATDHFKLSGSQSAGELQDLRARGIDPLEIDVQFVLANPGARKFGDELREILREGTGAN